MTAPSTSFVDQAGAVGIEPRTLARIRDTGGGYEITRNLVDPPVHRIHGPRGVVAVWRVHTGWVAVGATTPGPEPTYRKAPWWA